MKKIKCEQCEKYFNGEKFAICPYCNPIKQEAPAPEPSGNNAAPTPVVRPNPVLMDGEGPRDTIGGVKLYNRPAPVPNANCVRCPECGKTYDAFEYKGCPSCAEKSDHCRSIMDVLCSGHAQNGEGPTIGRVVLKRNPNPTDKLTNGNTPASNSSEEPRMESIKARPNYPVVGWLVCIDGNNVGRSYEVYDAQNSIGRNAENLIVLDGETSVSRSKHCMITYDYKHNEFWLMAGNNATTTYLNDALVVESTKLKADDILELGECKLLFVPFCSQERNWSTLISEK